MKHRITAVCLAAAVAFTSMPVYAMAAQDASDQQEQVGVVNIIEEDGTAEEIREEQETEEPAAQAQQPAQEAEEPAAKEAEAQKEPEQAVDEENKEEAADTEADAKEQTQEEPAEAEIQEVIEDEDGMSESNESMAATADGWVTENGKKYYYVNGKKSVGIVSIDGTKYVFNKDGTLGNGVVIVGRNNYVYYTDKNGVMQKGFHTIDGKIYYFMDENCTTYSASTEGKRLAGSRTIGGKKYYFADENMEGFNEEDAAAVVPGIHVIKGNDYVISETGEWKTGMSVYGGKIYFITGEKKLARNAFKTGSDGNIYYFGSDGAAVKGWNTIDGNTYHMASNFVVDTSWKSIKGYRYYFDTNGVMLKGWQKINGKTYYLGDDGKMAKGWKKILVGTVPREYYFHTDGHKQENGRLQIDGVWCAFDRSGICTKKDSTINDVVVFAKKWEGKIPYKSSVTKNDPNDERKMELKAGRGSDCSWFVFNCLAKYGYQTKFVNSYQWGSKPELYGRGKSIGTSISEAKAGDIICYSYAKKGEKRTGNNSHVEIYLGGGKQIGCCSGKGVVKSSVDESHIIDIVRFN